MDNYFNQILKLPSSGAFFDSQTFCVCDGVARSDVIITNTRSV